MNDDQTPNFNHAEAFALMHYGCRECGHMETIWNSRDGVTPFSIPCPSCGGSLQHVNWSQDRRDQNHVPNFGQRVFINLSIEKATGIAKERVLSRRKMNEEAEELISVVAKEIYGNGTQPDIRIEGF